MGYVMTGEENTSLFGDKKSNDSTIQSHEGIVTLIDDIKEIEKRFCDEQDFKEIEPSEVLIDICHPELSISAEPDDILDDSLVRKIHGDPEFIEVPQTGYLEKRPVRSTTSKPLKMFQDKLVKRVKDLSHFRKTGTNLDELAVPATFTLQIDGYGNLVGFHPPLSKPMQKIVSVLAAVVNRLPTLTFTSDTQKGIRGKIIGIFSFLPFIKSSEKKQSGSPAFLERLKNILPKIRK
jgi:hypothetical protein